MSRARGHLLVLLAVLVSVILVPPAELAQARKRPCTSAHSQTILSTERVRIFDKNHFRYGCDYRRRLKMRLGASGVGVETPSNDVSDMRLADSFVAYTLYTAPISSAGPFSTTDVRLVDLRHGRRFSPATGCDHRQEPTDGNVVSDLVLSASGAMAWICIDVLYSEVHKLDASGVALLDTAPGNSVTALALSGSSPATLYWTSGSTLHSATLRGPPIAVAAKTPFPARARAADFRVSK